MQELGRGGGGAVPQVLRGEQGEGRQRGVLPASSRRSQPGPAAWVQPGGRRCRHPQPCLHPPPPPSLAGEQPPGQAALHNRSRTEPARSPAGDAGGAGEMERSILLVLGLRGGLGGTEFSETLPAVETQFPLCKGLWQ